MKIAIIGSRGIPAQYGGFEVLAEKLAVGLSERGGEVCVYCLERLKEIDFVAPGVKRNFVKTPSLSSLEKLWLSNYSVFHCLFKEKIDAIIFLGASAGLFMWLPKIFSKRLIINLDGLEWKRSRWNFLGRILLKVLEKLAIKWADVRVADSMEIGKYIQDKYKKDFVYIPYGADPCHCNIETLKDPEGGYNLKPDDYYIAVGRNVPENNLDMIVEGFLLSNSSKKLVIISNEQPRIPENDRIIFTGPIYDRSKLFALRKNAFAHIHGHSVGGTNPSLLEAISCRNIVLAYDVPFNREVLGDYGFYFNNSRKLAYIINGLENGSIVSDKEKTLEYYNKIIKERYNWELVVNKYAEVLEMKGGDE